MISVILYGRNDSHGYNLHKRAALSLNCISEILTDVSDEIIFVDYNSPDDFPTFPEAIQDTLTENAKARLRILRVRPSLHARYANKSGLPVLEGIARNIGIRRSNPENRWILSTNTDMIFVPHKVQSLSLTAEGLAPGLYHLPRFEVPETIWESLDRNNPRKAIEAMRHWGHALHMNEIVIKDPIIRFDAPGDFQLMERRDLLRIHGFNEEMLSGWHLDSNIATRLYLLYGRTEDLIHELYGYHCSHERQLTLRHFADSVIDDYSLFVESVQDPVWDKHGFVWGAPNDHIEELRLGSVPSQVYLRALKAVISEVMVEPTVSPYVHENYDAVRSETSHVLPFVADIFVNASKTANIAWLGADEELFSRMTELWYGMGFESALLQDQEIARLIGTDKLKQTQCLHIDALAATADAFVFDFARKGGRPPRRDQSECGEQDKRILSLIKLRFLAIIASEKERLRLGKALRRIVCVNAIHNNFEPFVTSFVCAGRTPFSTRIRQGFIFPQCLELGEEDWTKKMHVGLAGIRVGSTIKAVKGKAGHVLYGPYVHLSPGEYNVIMNVVGYGSPRRWLFKSRSVSACCEVVSGDCVLARRYLDAEDLRNATITLDFSISTDRFGDPGLGAIEARIWSDGSCEFSVTSVKLRSG